MYELKIFRFKDALCVSEPLWFVTMMKAQSEGHI
jgi:hypothetical protein